MDNFCTVNFAHPSQQAKLPKTCHSWLIIFFFLLLIHGCALTTDHITIIYEPQGGVAKLAGAENVTVSVDIFDIRSDKTRVSSKKNAYGMEMAAIIAENNVPQTLSNAIQTELVNRGFVIGNGPARLLVDLQKYYNDFKTGFWSGTAVAELLMSVQVKDPDANIVFAKLVTGDGSLPGIQLASGENAKVALESALSDGIAKLFNDKSYIDALFRAARADSIKAPP